MASPAGPGEKGGGAAPRAEREPEHAQTCRVTVIRAVYATADLAVSKVSTFLIAYP